MELVKTVAKCVEKRYEHSDEHKYAVDCVKSLSSERLLEKVCSIHDQICGNKDRAYDLNNPADPVLNWCVNEDRANLFLLMGLSAITFSFLWLRIFISAIFLRKKALMMSPL